MLVLVLVGWLWLLLLCGGLLRIWVLVLIAGTVVWFWVGWLLVEIVVFALFWVVVWCWYYCLFVFFVLRGLLLVDCVLLMVNSVVFKFYLFYVVFYLIVGRFTCWFGWLMFGVGCLIVSCLFVDV